MNKHVRASKFIILATACVLLFISSSMLAVASGQSNDLKGEVNTHVVSETRVDFRLGQNYEDWLVGENGVRRRVIYTDPIAVFDEGSGGWKYYRYETGLSSVIVDHPQMNLIVYPAHASYDGLDETWTLLTNENLADENGAWREQPLENWELGWWKSDNNLTIVRTGQSFVGTLSVAHAPALLPSFNPLGQDKVVE